MSNRIRLVILLLLAAGVAVALSQSNPRTDTSHGGGSHDEAACPTCAPEANQSESFTPAEETPASPVVEKTAAKASIPAGLEKKPVPPKPAKPQKPTPSALPKLVDLGATKCLACKMMATVLDELKSENRGKLEVVFIDVWEDKEASKEYGVKSIPTQVLYDSSGKEIFRHEGFFAKKDILAKFAENGVHL